jgi:hypothetical protein
MPASALDGLAHFIHSVPGQISVGGSLFYGVQKFAKTIEDNLREETKGQMAEWLGVLKAEPRLESWPKTFYSVFERVFGRKHLSWTCFFRSSAASLLFGFIGFVLAMSYDAREWGAVGLRFDSLDAVMQFGELFTPVGGIFTDAFINAIASNHIMLGWLILAMWLIMMIIVTNSLPDFVSLYETRIVLRTMQRLRGVWLPILIAVDFAATILTAAIWNVVWMNFCGLFNGVGPDSIKTSIMVLNSWGLRYWFLFPALGTSVWLWLYAAAGLLLRSAHRFDLGFNWFRRKFDIEKKPLQSIGLVAGAIAALVYWAAVGIRHLV